jgi:hypothetical protein
VDGASPLATSTEEGQHLANDVVCRDERLSVRLEKRLGLGWFGSPGTAFRVPGTRIYEDHDLPP